jgi:hypothetical protein
MARTPAGSMAPGTVARAALALGAADTGRVAPPRPLAELLEAAGEPLELLGVLVVPLGLLAAELLELPGALAVPLELPGTVADPLV